MTYSEAKKLATKKMRKWTYEHTEAETAMRALIPAHLNADELIINSWNNAGETADSELNDQILMGYATTLAQAEVEVFKATALMFIDQDCTS